MNMAQLRPAVQENDNYLSRIIKYIPAEIIAVYTAIAGILKPKDSASLPSAGDIRIYFVVLMIILVVTPVWTYYSTKDRDGTGKPGWQRKVLFHAAVATISFIIWVYAIGDVLFRGWLCNLAEQCKEYSPVLGSVVLVLYTGLLVPLIERIVIGKPTAQKQKVFASQEQVVN